jgi:hypothetical protein
MAWYWPDVYTVKRAQTAARVGACVCFGFAVLDAGLVARRLATGTAVGASLLDLLHFTSGLTLPLFGCLLFAFAGWRIWNFSRAWAIVVLVWYLFQTGRIVGVLLMLLPPFLLVAFALVTAVRGTLAYDWLSKAHAQAARESPAAVENCTSPGAKS